LESVFLGVLDKVSIPVSQIAEWEKDLEQRRIEDFKLCETARLNNLGMAAEKSGDIEAAIKLYEENIRIGYHATHSYDRLMIIYRRQKGFESELRVIDCALKVFTMEGYSEFVAKLERRRLKVEKYLNREAQDEKQV
jgi:tetratricopeptide (TPR) repeat protein